MAKPFLTQPSDALVEMLQRDGEWDRLMNGEGLRFEKPIELGPPPKPPQPFYPPAPDWEAEAREMRQREQEQERQQRDKIIAEELERIAREDEETRPAKKRRWRT